MILYKQINKFEAIKDYDTVNTYIQTNPHTSLRFMLLLFHYGYLNLAIKLIGYESTLMKWDTIEQSSELTLQFGCLVVCLYKYFRVEPDNI